MGRKESNQTKQISTQCSFIGACALNYKEEYRDHIFFHALTFASSLRKLFEYEADRPSAQASPEGPGK